MKKLLFVAALAFTGSTASFAQNSVGIGTTTPAASAALDVTSITQGFLLPRISRAQLNVIAAPATGLMVYCLDCTPAGLRVYNGTAFQSVAFPATFTTSSLSCSGALSGTYMAGTATTAANTKVVNVTLATAGPFTVTTDLVNGIYFSRVIVATGTGSQNVALIATGMPTAAGTFSYTAIVGLQTCTFSVTVAQPATFACNNATNTFTPTGNLVNGTSYSGTYMLPYAAGNGSTYATMTLTQNGLSLTRTAGTYASGGGNVVYTP